MKKIITLTASLILAISLLTSCNNTTNQKVENNEVKKELSNPAEIIKKDDEKNIILTKKDKNIFYWNTQITSDWDTNLEENNFDRAWEKFIAYDLIGNYKSFALYERSIWILNAWMWSFTLFSYDWKESKNINELILSSLGLENTIWNDILIGNSEFIKTQIIEDEKWVYMDLEFQTWIKDFQPQNSEWWEIDLPAVYLDETKKLWSEFQITKKADKLKKETWMLRFYFSKK